MKNLLHCKLIQHKYKLSRNKKYIKLINERQLIKISEYKYKEKFHEISTLKLNRKIKFEGLPTNDNPKQWLYLFTINDYIVKIGGTRCGLKGRMTSYLSGSYPRAKASETNKTVYNTLEFYLKCECEVKLYGYKIPETELALEVLDEIITITPQIYHIYEKKLLEKYIEDYTQLPPLNCNIN